MARSKIDWCDYVWNPIVGCSKVSAGCMNCYAETMARRLKGMGLPQYQDVVDEHGWTGKVVFAPDALDKPLKWRKPRRVFVGSMTDLFHPNIKYVWLDQIFAVMGRSQQHIFQILTKRPDFIVEYLEAGRYQKILDIAYRLSFREEGMGQGISNPNDMSRWPNVHLGTTIENQKAADERIPYLLQIPAAVRFVSAEPLLGPLDLFRYLQSGLESWCEGHPDSPDPSYPGGFSRKLPGVRWVIVGAESGPRRRGCNLEWVRGLVRQCQYANVPVFVKQLDLDGRVSHDPAEWPEDLRVRKYPE